MRLYKVVLGSSEGPGPVPPSCQPGSSSAGTCTSLPLTQPLLLLCLPELLGEPSQEGGSRSGKEIMKILPGRRFLSPPNRPSEAVWQHRASSPAGAATPPSLQEHGEGTLLPPAPANTQPELTPCQTQLKTPLHPSCRLADPLGQEEWTPQLCSNPAPATSAPQVMLAPIRILAPFIPLLLVALGAWSCCLRSSAAAPAGNKRENSFLFSRYNPLSWATERFLFPAQVTQGVQSRVLAPTPPSLRGCFPEGAGTVLFGGKSPSLGAALQFLTMQQQPWRPPRPAEASPAPGQQSREEEMGSAGGRLDPSDAYTAMTVCERGMVCARYLRWGGSLSRHSSSSVFA